MTSYTKRRSLGHFHVSDCLTNKRFHSYDFEFPSQRMQDCNTTCMVGIPADQNTFKMEVNWQYMKPLILNIG